jgi:hypothetical protein
VTIASFKSDKELISFARVFFRDRVGSFCKDVAICLTPRKKKGKPTEHAEFPALITCMGFADLLSGLYAGNIEGHDLKELKSYAARFMDAKHYDPHLLDILYLAFRHKIAHLASPYLVSTRRPERNLRARNNGSLLGLFIIPSVLFPSNWKTIRSNF